MLALGPVTVLPGLIDHHLHLLNTVGGPSDQNDAGFVVRGHRGTLMIAAGLILGTLAGLELSIREHFAGYRSHSSLLAGACAFVSMAILFFAGGKGDVTRVLMIPVGGVVFLAAFWVFRQAFKRRSGGLGFR